MPLTATCWFTRRAKNIWKSLVPKSLEKSPSSDAMMGRSSSSWLSIFFRTTSLFPNGTISRFGSRLTSYARPRGVINRHFEIVPAMPAAPDKCRLLHGPYNAPALHRGDRATCHLRGDVRITSWADARISWPRCQVLKGRGGCGLLLDDELARAVRTESAAAVSYWWGVSEGVVWR